VAGLLAVSLSAEAARFFRYLDASGKLVLSQTIPNDRVRYGYEIVDENARVIQKVAPQLSEEQYQRKLAREAAQKECRDVLQRVQRAYQSPADIDAAEEQALESIDTRIANAQANLAHVRNQKTDLEGEAARMDLAGRTLSQVLLNNIERAKSQENNLREEIEQRRKDKIELRSQYDFDREVFAVQSCKNGLPGRADVASGH
jgi:hypothetical protein